MQEHLAKETGSEGISVKSLVACRPPICFSVVLCDSWATGISAGWVLVLATYLQ